MTCQIHSPKFMYIYQTVMLLGRVATKVVKILVIVTFKNFEFWQFFSIVHVLDGEVAYNIKNVVKIIKLAINICQDVSICHECGDMQVALFSMSPASSEKSPVLMLNQYS